MKNFGKKWYDWSVSGSWWRAMWTSANFGKKWYDWSVSGSWWRAMWTSAVEVLVASFLGGIFLGFIGRVKCRSAGCELSRRDIPGVHRTGKING